MASDATEAEAMTVAAPDRTTGTVVFCLPIAGSQTHDRAIVEHDEGNWSIGKISRADRTKFERECSFSIPELQQIAVYGIEGNPNISTVANKQAGKVLAGGAILLMMAIGLIETEEKAQ